MLVLDNLLISNTSDPLVGTFTPASSNGVPPTLNLRFASGDVVIEGDEALLLFDHYVRTGKRIGSADHVLISRDAINTLQLFFEHLGTNDPITERRVMADQCRAIIKCLKART
jgi:hypothetical protein